MAKRPERVVLRGEQLGLPGIEQFGRYHYTSAQPELQPHTHDGTEICLLVSGRQVYHVGGESYVLTGGDQFVTFPGEVHHTAGEPEDRGMLYWLVVAANPAHPGLLYLNDEQSQYLQTAIRSLSSRRFPASATAAPALKHAFDLLVGHGRGSLRAASELTGYLLDTVAAAAETHARRGFSPLASSIEDYVSEHMAEPLSIEQLSAALATSTSHLNAVCRRHLGMAPGDYVMRARMSRAKELLTTTELPITAICYQVGYASPQAFATAFKRATGVPPTEFRSGPDRA